MDFNQKKRHYKGFTLLEVLVYVVVYAIIVGGISSISLAVYRNKVIIEDRVNVNEDMRVLNKSIRDDVYLGEDITVTSATSMTISKTGSDDIVYYESVGRVYRQVGTGTAVAVTSSNSEVDLFDIDDLSSPSAAETVRIRMTISNFERGSLRPPIEEDVTTTFSIKFL